mgnify:CR=1 FL=1
MLLVTSLLLFFIVPSRAFTVLNKAGSDSVRRRFVLLLFSVLLDVEVATAAVDVDVDGPTVDNIVVVFDRRRFFFWDDDTTELNVDGDDDALRELECDLVVSFDIVEDDDFSCCGCCCCTFNDAVPPTSTCKFRKAAT